MNSTVIPAASGNREDPHRVEREAYERSMNEHFLPDGSARPEAAIERAVSAPAGVRQESERCPTCHEDAPHTGTCGTHDGDTRALCKRAPSLPAGPAADPVATVLLRRKDAEHVAQVLRGALRWIPANGDPLLKRIEAAITAAPQVPATSPPPAPAPAPGREVLQQALEGIATHGLRCDTNPTVMFPSDPAERKGATAMYVWWTGYLREADDNLRKLARAALAAQPPQPAAVDAAWVEEVMSLVFAYGRVRVNLALCPSARGHALCNEAIDRLRRHLSSATEGKANDK